MMLALQNANSNIERLGGGEILYLENYMTSDRINKKLILKNGNNF